MIVPANHAWEEVSQTLSQTLITPQEMILPSTINDIATTLTNGKHSAIILGGRALREEALESAGRVADATGATLLCETFPARHQRRAGRVKVARIPYFVETAVEFLPSYEQFILAGAQIPVAFFAYPGKPSLLTPEGSSVKTLATGDACVLTALKPLADRVECSP